MCNYANEDCECTHYPFDEDEYEEYLLNKEPEEDPNEMDSLCEEDAREQRRYERSQEDEHGEDEWEQRYISLDECQPDY